MQPLYIIKTGSTFPDVVRKFGDFDAWVQTALGPVNFEIRTLDVHSDPKLPEAEACAGVIITGSHAMVTDALPWSLRLEAWIPSLLARSIPLLGICYGHQLLARATGGEAGFHPLGEEIGTVTIQRLPESQDDPLFGILPHFFQVHATHAQTVLRLPPQAIRLAANDHEPTHAFRLGSCAWGVQFHPEYTADIMRAYVEKENSTLRKGRIQREAKGNGVRDTPEAARLMHLFARLVEKGL